MPLTRKDYIPPLRYHWLTGAYDPVVRLLTRESTFKRALLREVDPRPGERLLDLGCGTGTLAISLSQACPEMEVIGVDTDAAALGIAWRKARRIGVKIDLQQASALRLPFASGSFDCVVSSLFFHHLTTSEKTLALNEACRVMKPGGHLCIADWGKPSTALMRASFGIVRLLDGFETTRDSVDGSLPRLIRAAGFRVEERTRFDTPLGTIRLFSAEL